METRSKFEVLSIILLGILMALLQAQILKGNELNSESATHTKTVRTTDASVTDLYTKGVHFLKNDNPDSAAKYFEITLSKNPEMIPAFVNLGRAYIETEQYDKANEVLTHAMTLDSMHSDLWKVYGRLLYNTENTDDAIRAYQQSIELSDYNPYARNNLALIYINEGRYQEAVELLKAAIRQKENVAYFHNNLGIALENMTSYQQAETAYQKALEVQANYTKAETNVQRIQEHIQNVSSVYQE
ncbi:MAG: tetratricopeptide repeat protein [Candidatus Marinimicrobia bacterium]|nr:tetratricopeptide repeat protein [Candidatus Neomarinimicrobiota bacterium]MCF7829588.1 tetratricopeptide repeat protein [Candidatus Neomarinimicrobiota bacterium]MCF7882242.1 tetratricopeptide repeat protein [Candidatus Neomarinimicrobiota bacterium]